MKNLTELKKLSASEQDAIRKTLQEKNKLTAEFKDGKVIITFTPVQTYKKEKAVKDPSTQKWMTDGTFQSILLASSRYGHTSSVRLPSGKVINIRIDAQLADNAQTVAGIVPEMEEVVL